MGILSVPKQGYWLRPRGESSPAGATHFLGGKFGGEGSNCPNCNKPLLLVLDLGAHDLRLGLSQTGLLRLPLLFCWTCIAAESTIRYRVDERGNRITLLEFERGDMLSGYPKGYYPWAFPQHQLALHAITETEQAVLQQINRAEDPGFAAAHYSDLARPAHQVGGEPYLVQPIQQTLCKECGVSMPLFAATSNETFSPEKFADYDWVQVLFHVCRTCRVVACYQLMD
jgi:hypothetical protein